MPTLLDWRQIKDNSIPASKIIGGVPWGWLSYADISSSGSISVWTFYGVNASSWNIVLTLPDWINLWDNLTVKKTDSSSNTITVTGSNIDWDTSVVISIEDESIDLFWTGTKFLIN